MNFRVLPGDTVDDVYDHVVDTIDDERVVATMRRESRNPSPVSSIESEGFKAIQQTITTYFPDSIVSPYLVVGGTDARYYAEVSTDQYRFAPFRYNREDRERIHGTNERIAIETLGHAVGFYTQLIRATASR